MFDGLEMGLFPLVARPALRELFGPGTNESTIGEWFGVITAGFLVGAATGGVLFGWLGDRIGRVRAMTVSVLVYAGCSGICAFAAAPWQLAILRFAGALGMGGEWALGVALVMELWPNSSRAWLAGWIGAFGNLGYLVVGGAAIALNRIGTEIDAGPLTAKGNWRLLMLVGAVPAVLTLFIRLLVPESEKWRREKEAGAASHWSGTDLLAVLVGAAVASAIIVVWAGDFGYPLRVATTVPGLVVVGACYLFPARQYLVRSGLPAGERGRTLGRMVLAAGLSGVPLLGTWAGVMWMYNWADKLVQDADGFVPDARPQTQIASSFGAAVGCIIGALLGDRFGRRVVYAGLCVLSAGTVVGFFHFNTGFGPAFVASAGVLGAVTAAFYGWLPLYLPELFPTGIRATGQGFGFNFGRIIAAVGALQTGTLLKAFDNDYAKACSLVAVVYAVGLLLIAIAPETRGKPLPE
jgi:MFS family permease